MKQIWLPQSGDEWLSFTDVVITANLSAFFEEMRDSLEIAVDLLGVEVGVWKGSWALSFLMNNSGSHLVGVDPYPSDDGATVRAAMLARMLDLGVDARFDLYPDWGSVELASGLDVVHIDGLHTEEAVRSDLIQAQELLVNDGLIVVDDFRHRWFPGVTSALFEFVHGGDFRVLMDSGNKAYLIRERYLMKARDAMRKSVDGRAIRLLNGSWEARETHPYRYKQSPRIAGCDVLLAEPEIRNSRRVREALRDWVPPAIWKALADSRFRSHR